MTEPQQEPTGITNTGPVFTAAQGDHATGYVGAMGPNATGNVFVSGAKGAVQAELQELVTRLRSLLAEHGAELADPGEAEAAIDVLDQEVQDGAEPEKLRRATLLVRALTRPVAAFAELVNRIFEIIERFRA
jgi:hypothetical protein